ncbi:endopeptidase La [candidate division KSB1 bacterium]|nr:endopeptidase La [candidate division KSB1 bacterium]
MPKTIHDEIKIEIPDVLPVLPLKDVVMFPGMVFPLLVGKEPSLRAIEEALMAEKVIFLSAQKAQDIEEPTRNDIYRLGVISRILQVIKLPNSYFKMLIEGLLPGRIKRFTPKKEYFEARIEPIIDADINNPTIMATVRHVISLFKEYVRLNRNIPDELLLTLENFTQPRKIADFISSHLMINLEDKQKLLESRSIGQHLLKLAQILENEKEILEIERNIEKKVRHRIQKSQRNYYLQEQIRVLREELGDESEPDSEILELKNKIESVKMPPAVLEKAVEELNRLDKMPMMSPEATVIRNYLDWLIAVPWHEETTDTLDIHRAKQILDEDHYGLTKTKDRILEYLAVLQLVKKMKGPILCFVGPPGTGKTSLGKSIARAMGRNFIRVSLGGIRDEAEIRGHRRTYIGSMPGRIIQSMKRAKTVNPVFLLDEIDKMSMDFRGDPAAALLEVLDPEQNATFNDHYLEIDYDLSKVFFITTANVQDAIPEPLLDRMEIIHLPGYMEFEKLEIARGFLIPRQLQSHGLDAKRLQISDETILTSIRQYTREAGVRNLERKIASICRKVARQIVTDGVQQPINITRENLETYLGVPYHAEKSILNKELVGTATGLAWTRFGGDILEIQVTIMPGKGNLTMTGNLGDVMKESAMAALSYARTNTQHLNIPAEFYQNHDIHIHVPEGAIPKDGPSAGVTIASALISALCGVPVKQDVAMTGEITLRGNVLAIGGLNEKMMAAQRIGIATVLIPKENEKDFHDLPKELRDGIQVHLIEKLEEIFEYAFVTEPKAEGVNQ